MALSTTLAEALAALAAFVGVSDTSQDVRREMEYLRPVMLSVWRERADWSGWCCGVGAWNR